MMIPLKQRISRPTVIVLALLLFIPAASCGGDNGGSSSIPIPDPIVASFTGSGTGEAPDQVRLTGSVVGDIVSIDINIGGPTTSSDLYSFAFDVVLSNANVARYMAGSASFGDALTLEAGQQGDVLVGDAVDRLTIGITKLGGGAGNGIAAGESTLATLQFRVIAIGSTTIQIEGSPPEAPTALDSVGNPIVSIQFDGIEATLLGT